MAKTVREFYNIGSVLPKFEHFIAGTELEVEDVLDVKFGGLFPDWTIEKDGSLRNAGKEFISPPLDAAALVKGFKGVHASIIHSPEPVPFTERTSIHVHVNCLDVDTEKVKNIILWYALFEPVFFAMCAPNRSHNIHCVPLDQTHLSSKYKRTLGQMVEAWSKYTALNILPLASQGTIEFRHMEGHDNPERFESWLKTLENLWLYGQSTQLNKYVLTTPESVMSSFDAIFKDALIKSLRSSVPALVADSLIDVKLALA